MLLYVMKMCLKSTRFNSKQGVLGGASHHAPTIYAKRFARL